MYSVGTAYLLWFLSFFGMFGFHRFYLGKIPTGVLWMLTGGLGMFGAIYDFFTLRFQVEEANRRHGFVGSNGTVVHNNIVNNFPQELDQFFNGKRRDNADSIEYLILSEAKKNGGIVTATDIVLAAHISLDEAKRTLDSLVTQGYAELKVRKTGTLVYAIPELLDRNIPLEDI
ncbi:MAG: TM2 domain-containing protein [Treponema sp.]|jgi:TM2 domain-containing membrane protein YozV/predicted transcriptional regulator|nr:TM2 domain-containing protein [Treponema sp.]